MKTQFNVLGISGSLRKDSLNSLFLRALKAICPTHIHFNIYNHLENIPIFNPDHSTHTNTHVDAWRQAIAQADLIILVSPEYAHGVSGSMKNALDWIVESGEFTDKYVAFPNLSIRTDLAYQQLAETLLVMGANIIKACSPQATISAPYILVDVSEYDLINHPEIKSRYAQLWNAIDFALNDTHNI